MSCHTAVGRPCVGNEAFTVQDFSSSSTGPSPSLDTSAVKYYLYLSQ